MSLQDRVTVSCPDCGEEQEVSVWSTLNVQVSPEARADFFAGRINVFECRSCRSQTRLVTPFAYHDMALKFYVQFYPSESLADEEVLGSLNPDGSTRGNPFGALDMPKETQDAMHYLLHPHVVFSMQEVFNYVTFRERLNEYHQTQKD